MFFENPADAQAGPGFDDRIGIEKSEAQQIRRQPAHHGFPGAHESDEHEILDAPCFIHLNSLANSALIRTQILSTQAEQLDGTARFLAAQQGGRAFAYYR